MEQLVIFLVVYNLFFDYCYFLQPGITCLLKVAEGSYMHKAYINGLTNL